jgi:hypothetical protein
LADMRRLCTSASRASADGQALGTRVPRRVQWFNARMPPVHHRKKAHEVFGVSNVVLPDSYVDRGELDEEVKKYLERPNHIALRGESKCGKSWLRQTVLPDAVVVQCRLGKTTLDIYRDALGQMDVRLEVERVEGTRWSGRIETTGDLGLKLLAKVGVKAAVEALKDKSTTTQRVGHDVSDLRFIAELLIASERRLVVEDFHYLSVKERTSFAFDLKALWDYGVFVVIVGVWSEQNMLAFPEPRSQRSRAGGPDRLGPTRSR